MTLDLTNSKDKAIHDLVNLSSGTIATLTGICNYDDQIKILNNVYEWAKENVTDADTWVTLWNRYHKEK